MMRLVFVLMHVAGRRNPRRSRRASIRRILKPLSDAWPSYSGDYTGRRYSALRQVNQSNVKNLDARVDRPSRRSRGRRRAALRSRAAQVIDGGVGNNEFVGATSIKGRILAVNNVLYVTAPDNVWALDAQTATAVALLLAHEGRHAHRQSRRGDVAQLSVLRHARRLPRLARCAHGQGTLAQGDRQLQPAVLLTSAPIVVDNHVIVGTGNDLDSPGYLLSFDPETGE